MVVWVSCYAFVPVVVLMMVDKIKTLFKRCCKKKQQPNPKIDVSKLEKEEKTELKKQEINEKTKNEKETDNLKEKNE